ncbi:divergent protein kinase domain 2A-like, partial [Stegodyphus dumicola]|uniref:divergent protein kinase domain 2A-like n=1 Tax=Stegodyphus dumicola TaxID=202533 RepID=UPI0015B23572
MGKKKLLCYSVLVICLIICLKILLNLHVDLSDDQFTNVGHCPACYGSNLCPEFYHGDIFLIGISKGILYRFVNVKNVYLGKFRRDKVILKKLAHDREFYDMDNRLCELSKLEKSCQVSSAVKSLVEKSTVAGQIQLLNILNSFESLTDATRCPSERLLKYMFGKLRSEPSESLQSEYVQNFKVGEMMYSLLINPEAVILQ